MLGNIRQVVLLVVVVGDAVGAVERNPSFGKNPRWQTARGFFVLRAVSPKAFGQPKPQQALYEQTTQTESKKTTPQRAELVHHVRSEISSLVSNAKGGHDFAYPAGEHGNPSGVDAVEEDSHVLPRHEQRRVCAEGMRAHWARGRVHGDERAGRDESRHRHRGCVHGFSAADRGHRPGPPALIGKGGFRKPTSMDDAAGGEAQLSDHGHQ